MIHGYRILLYAGPVLLVLFIMARFIVADHIKKTKKLVSENKSASKIEDAKNGRASLEDY